MLRPLVCTCCVATVGGLFAYVTLNFIVEGVDQARSVGIVIQGFLAKCAVVWVL